MYKHKPSRRSGKTLAVMVPALLAATAWSFGQATFQQTTGSQSWNTAANWTPTGVPSGTDVAVIFNAPTAAESVSLGASQTVGSFTIHDNSTFALTLSNTSGLTLTLSASSGTATASVDGTSTAVETVASALVLSSSLDVTVSNTSVTSTSGAITFTGAMTGTGGFIKDGDGTASMTTATKAYTGTTVVNAGVLRTSASGEANATSALTVNSGGQFRLDSTAGAYQIGTSSTVITLNGAGDANLSGTTGTGALANYGSGASTLANAVVLASNTTIYGNTAGTASLALNGVVSGTGSTLTKAGIGTLILTNASNSYSGGTIVSAGTLLVNAGVANTSSAAGTGAITVNSGTLGGSGNISGAVTVTGGTLLAGSGVTGTALTLTLSGNLDTTAQGTVIGLTLGASGAHSTLARAGGNWMFNSAQVFTLSGAPAVGTYTDVISGLASDPGTESAWSVTNANYVETFTYDPTGTTPGIDLNITAAPTAVPEPTTVLGGALLVGLTAWTQRRRLGGALGLPA